jgi:hypothetical protein
MRKKAKRVHITKICRACTFGDASGPVWNDRLPDNLELGRKPVSQQQTGN